jgi:hypothetical protein
MEDAMLSTRKVRDLFLGPYPIRDLAKEVIQKWEIGSYIRRSNLAAVPRPHYGYCVYHAAVLGKKLGHSHISVLEYGVAGGNGLINLEYHTKEVSNLLSMDIDIYGFDTGEGLPQPSDYRDLPYHYRKGFYRMNVPKIQQRLKKATLVLGDITKTSREFFERYHPAPIGAIAYDLDFYSSTAAALKMLEGDQRCYLPRLFCYFDDTVGEETELFNDYTGQRLAINEFNQAHQAIKFSPPYHLLARRIAEPWYHQMWICHFFAHSRYNDFVSDEDQQLPI